MDAEGHWDNGSLTERSQHPWFKEWLVHKKFHFPLWVLEYSMRRVCLDNFNRNWKLKKRLPKSSMISEILGFVPPIIDL